MKRMVARALVLAGVLSVGLAAPAAAVYQHAGTFALDATTANQGFAVDQQGNVFVLNSAAPWVTKYAPTGQRLVQFGAADQVSAPKGIATDAAGGVYVSDESKVTASADSVGQVHVFSTAGSFQRTIEYDDPLYGPGSGFTVDGAGNLYITQDEVKVFSPAGQKTGTIGYGRVDGSDAGAIAGDPTGNRVFGRANAGLGEAVLTFDSNATELGILTSPSTASGQFNWFADRLAANVKGQLIVLDTYCQAAIVFSGQTVVDAAQLGTVLMPGGQRAAPLNVGTDAAGAIYVLMYRNSDKSYHVARLVPGSGSANLPQKGCKDLPGASAGGGSTKPPTTPPATPPASSTGAPKFTVPPQVLQNRRFLVGLSCSAACNATVSAKALIGRKRHGAGRRSEQLAAGGSGTIELTVPKRTYRRIVRRLKAGKGTTLRVSVKVRYADGRTFTTKASLPLNPA